MTEESRNRNHTVKITESEEHAINWMAGLLGTSKSEVLRTHSLNEVVKQWNEARGMTSASSRQD